MKEAAYRGAALLFFGPTRRALERCNNTDSENNRYQNQNEDRIQH